MNELSVLVVENEPTVRCLLKDFLVTRGHPCEVAESGSEALTMIPDINPAVVVTGLHLPDMTGLELDSEIRRKHPLTTVIIQSGEESNSNYTEIVKDKAFSFSNMFQQFVGIADSLSEIDDETGDSGVKRRAQDLAQTELKTYESLLDILLELRTQMEALQDKQRK